MFHFVFETLWQFQAFHELPLLLGVVGPGGQPHLSAGGGLVVVSDGIKVFLELLKSEFVLLLGWIALSVLVDPVKEGNFLLIKLLLEEKLSRLIF